MSEKQESASEVIEEGVISQSEPLTTAGGELNLSSSSSGIQFVPSETSITETKKKEKITVIMADKKDTDKAFQCAICNRKFKNNHGVKVHMISHNPTHQCAMCSAKYKIESSLLKHIALAHVPKEIPPQLDTIVTFPQGPPQTTAPTQVQSEGLSHNTHLLSRQNLDPATETFQTVLPGKEFLGSQQGYPPPGSAVSQQGYPPPPSPPKSTLSQRGAFMPPYGPSRPPLFKETSPQQGSSVVSVTSHSHGDVTRMSLMKTPESGIPIPTTDTQPQNKYKYKCPECDADFKSEDIYKLHVYRRHVQPIIYNCKKCGASFEILSEYEKHTSSHSTDKQ